MQVIKQNTMLILTSSASTASIEIIYFYHASAKEHAQIKSKLEQNKKQKKKLV